MRGFGKELGAFLDAAVEAGAIGDEEARRLAAFGQRWRPRGPALRLAAVLGWLGGLAVALGALLLVAANWDSIPDGAKLGGALALLAGAHGAGFALASSSPRTADALHFVGGGLFLATTGLIAQIWQLDPRPPTFPLLWLAAVAPLALLLSSPLLTFQALVALVLWAHIEGALEGSPLQTTRGPAPHFVLALGLGGACAGLGALVRDRVPEPAAVLRAAGVLLVVAALYALGFFRHLGEPDAGDGTPLLPLAALAAATAAVAAGAGRLARGAPRLRPRLLGLLAAALLLGLGVLAVDAGWIPRGPAWGFPQFGREVSHDAAEWILSGTAWALWFLLALWCMAFGVEARHAGYVNLGVVAFGLGIVTRFFDLIGTLASTGTIFLAGGAVLLATAWGIERWRRDLTARMEAGR